MKTYKSILLLAAALLFVSCSKSSEDVNSLKKDLAKLEEKIDKLEKIGNENAKKQESDKNTKNEDNQKQENNDKEPKKLRTIRIQNQKTQNNGKISENKKAEFKEPGFYNGKLIVPDPGNTGDISISKAEEMGYDVWKITYVDGEMAINTGSHEAFADIWYGRDSAENPLNTYLQMVDGVYLYNNIPVIYLHTLVVDSGGLKFRDVFQSADESPISDTGGDIGFIEYSAPEYFHR